jgi:UDP-3-O-[3-hydroxymyristoyl] glucosamine N-acyltransferase
LVILAARPLHQAQTGHITFLDHDKHLPELHASLASAAVVAPEMTPNGKALIRVADPLAAFVTIVRHLHGTPDPPAHGIDPLASIHHTAIVGMGASIFPFAVVGPACVIGDRCRIHSGAVLGRNCRLGDDVTLYAHAVLYDNTVLGSRVIVHANAVLGADGFGYRFQDGRHVKVPQLGSVEVGDDVEIGAGAKIDNLVMIGHNCQIGRHNILVSQVGMAGSSSTGDYVVIAGQVGVVDHVHIGDRSVIGGQAAVTKDVPQGQRMLGSPATPEREQKRILMSLAGLPDIRKRLRVIEQRVGIGDNGAAE